MMSEEMVLLVTVLSSVGVFFGIAFAAGITRPYTQPVTRWIRCPLDDRDRVVRLVTDSLNAEDYDEVFGCSRFGRGDVACGGSCRFGGKLDRAMPSWRRPGGTTRPSSSGHVAHDPAP